MRIMIENFISVFGDQDKILDPAAEYFREIYALLAVRISALFRFYT